MKSLPDLRMSILSIMGHTDDEMHPKPWSKLRLKGRDDKMKNMAYHPALQESSH